MEKEIIGTKHRNHSRSGSEILNSSASSAKKNANKAPHATGNNHNNDNVFNNIVSNLTTLNRYQLAILCLIIISIGCHYTALNLDLKDTNSLKETILLIGGSLSLISILLLSMLHTFTSNKPSLPSNNIKHHIACNNCASKMKAQNNIMPERKENNLITGDSNEIIFNGSAYTKNKAAKQYTDTTKPHKKVVLTTAPRPRIAPKNNKPETAKKDNYNIHTSVNNISINTDTIIDQNPGQSQEHKETINNIDTKPLSISSLTNTTTNKSSSNNAMAR